MKFPETNYAELAEFVASTQPIRRNRFFEPYLPVIQQMCRAKLAPGDAGDVEQDACLKVVRQVSRGKYDRAEGRFRDWLRAVVNHVICDFFRGRAHQLPSLAQGGTALLEILDSQEDKRCGVARVKASDEASDKASTPASQADVIAQSLARARRSVPARDWAIFQRIVGDEHSMAEVAEEFGLSIRQLYRIVARVQIQARQGADQ